MIKLTANTGLTAVFIGNSKDHDMVLRAPHHGLFMYMLKRFFISSISFLKLSTMKRFFGIKMFFVGLLVAGGMLLSANSASAQSSMPLDLDHNWKTEAEATQLLGDQLVQLGADLQQLTPGTASYEAAYNQMSFYKLAATELENGASTEDSVVHAATFFNDTKDSMGKMLPTTEIVQLFTVSVGLLTN